MFELTTSVQEAEEHCKTMEKYDLNMIAIKLLNKKLFKTDDKIPINAQEVFDITKNLFTKKDPVSVGINSLGAEIEMHDEIKQLLIEYIKKPTRRAALKEKLSNLDDQTGKIAKLRLELSAVKEEYVSNAKQLSSSRKIAAKKLDQQVMQQLPVLKLETSEFKTNIQLLEESKWNVMGIDKVRFEARTNPGQLIGAIDKIASGGELARFLLALKVVLSEGYPDKCLIFDEVDSGVGGAVADAVGTRLFKLAKTIQTLVVTHSPQVASKGENHFKITKSSINDKVISHTLLLNEEEHIEEVARMLAGEQITDAARMAARTLIDD